MKQKLRFTAFVLIFALIGLSAFAKTGKEINTECRANLKKLTEATSEMLKNHKIAMVPWKDFDNVYKSTPLINFLKEKPVPPTSDCKYCLLGRGEKDFYWYCDLHGLLSGNKTVTFKYHEFELTGKINIEFENIGEYSNHTKRMLQWTEYRQSPVEMLLYNYNSNPITTVIACVIITIVGLYILKQLY